MKRLTLSSWGWRGLGSRRFCLSQSGTSAQQAADNPLDDKLPRASPARGRAGQVGKRGNWGRWG